MTHRRRHVIAGGKSGLSNKTIFPQPLCLSKQHNTAKNRKLMQVEHACYHCPSIASCFPSLILPQIDGLMNRQYLYGWHVSSLWLLGIVAYRSILTIQQWRKIFGIQEAQPHTEFQTSCCQHHQCVQVTVFI